jgi:uncharacterized protein (TIGR01777 family)
MLVTGSTGLLGKALVRDLRHDRIDVVRLVRGREDGTDTASWDPAANQLDPAAVEGFDAVVHLAAENIGDGRWTQAKKNRIMESRRRGTRLLAERLAGATDKPAVLVCASAVGYYGDRGEEILTEESSPGSGFLSDVVREWEDATRAAASAGIRVVNVRNGVILSTEGGALAKMVPAFKMGVGGPLGDGSQWVSWLSLHDAVRAIRHALDTPSLSGPVNVAAEPVRGKEFANALGTALHRPSAIPVPLFAVRLVLGEGADEMTASQRVSSGRLLGSGFRFEHAAIETAMQHALQK